MKSCRTNLQVAISIFLLGLIGSADLLAYPLTLEQRKRLKKYLPRTFPKLEARDPVHVVAIGDSVMLGYTPLPSAWENGNSLFTYPGIFLEKVAREWFYTGGVELLNPPKGGTSKATSFKGEEIRFENLSTMDAVMLSGIQRTTTNAFIHNPDLLLIQYGTNDVLAGTSLDAFKRALHETIEAGKKQKSDIIVFSPSILNFGGGAMNWGITRPFTSAAREICDIHGVMFIDLGQHLIKWGGAGVDPDTHPQAAMEIVGGTLTKIFQFGPDLETKEKIYPCLRAHQNLGKAVFQELLNGPHLSDFSVAGTAVLEGEGSNVKVILSLRNQSTEEKQGTIGALALGQGMIPVVPAQRFVIPAGKNAQFEFQYDRSVVGKNRAGADLYMPFEIDDDVCRFSFVLEDSFAAEFIELPLRVGPVSVAWKSKQFVNITDRLHLEWNLINGTSQSISGQYQIGLGDSVATPVNFSLAPLGNKPFFADFEFKNEAGQEKLQSDVWVEVRINGQVHRFDREMEATKDLALGEAMPMSSWAGYVNAPPAVGNSVARKRPSGRVDVRFDISEKFLSIIATINGLNIPDLGKNPALRAELSIDARPAGEVRSFGFVDPVVIYTKGTDGDGYTMPLDLGAFGNGYNMILDSRGISSELKTAENGERILEIRVPKSYLHRIDWGKISPETVLGVKFQITPANSDGNPASPFDERNSFLTNSASFNFQNKTIHGHGSKDARGLTTLRLSKDPGKTWSVRLY